MKIKLLLLALLSSLVLASAVFYSSETNANLIFDYKICKHNGAMVTVVEADAACPDSENPLIKPQVLAIDASLNKAHNLLCVDTEEFIPGQ